MTRQVAEQNLGTSRLAVAGRTETIAAFAAAGLAACPIEPGPEAAERLAALVESGYRVIFFTEDLLPHIGLLLGRYRRDATPCLVPLPLGDSSASMTRLREVVRRAVGADVFVETTERSV